MLKKLTVLTPPGSALHLPGGYGETLSMTDFMTLFIAALPEIRYIFLDEENQGSSIVTYREEAELRDILGSKGTSPQYSGVCGQVHWIVDDSFEEHDVKNFIRSVVHQRHPEDSTAHKSSCRMDETIPEFQLSQLPAEIKDTVASYLLHQRDLLALALTHSTWRDIVIPFHLHYRIVQCSEDDADMWDHLQGNPRRLQNIRSLQLRDKRYWKQRPLLQHPTARGVMIPAGLIGRMDRLKTFRWESSGPYRELPPSFQSDEDFEEYRDSLLRTVLESCLELEEIAVLDKFARGACPTKSQKNAEPHPIVRPC